MLLYVCEYIPFLHHLPYLQAKCLFALMKRRDDQVLHYCMMEESSSENRKSVLQAFYF